MASGEQRYRNAYLIYNPNAGKLRRHQGALLQRIIDALRHAGHAVTPLATTGPNVAGDMARDAVARGADLVISAGGDGTMNEVLNGVVHSAVPLAIIPAGTANVLGVELRMRGGPVGAARELGAYVPVRISAGVLKNELNPNGRYFLLMAGAGLDARIVYDINASLKSRLGKGAYWVAGFGQLGRKFPALDVRVQGRAVTCSFALMSRVRNYGGDLYIARGASLLRDDFEMVLFEGRQSWVYLRYLFGVLTDRLHKIEGVTVTRAGEMELTCASDPRIYVQIDGEYAGRLPGRVEIAHKAVTLLVPPQFASRNG